MHDMDSGMIIEKILLKQTSLSSATQVTRAVIGCGDTFSCEFQCGG